MDRYSRQVLFRPIGESGQKAIGCARIAVVGCGALGTVSAELLARAGVGFLRLIDRDFVELSNLQRQSLYTEADALAHLPKAVAAKRTLELINSEVEVEGVVADLTFENIDDLCGGVGLIVDGTDNFETRFLLNDFSVHRGVPWLYGAALGSYGITFAVQPGQTACLRCLFPDLPGAGTGETCDTVGILGPTIHVVSSLQVAQALKYLTTGRLPGRILQFDIWENEWKSIALPPRDTECPSCGLRRLDFLSGESRSLLTRLCGRNAVQIRPAVAARLDLEALRVRLEPFLAVESNPYLLRFRADSLEVTVFGDGRAIVKGTESEAEARSVYARYVGL